MLCHGRTSSRRLLVHQSRLSYRRPPHLARISVPYRRYYSDGETGDAKSGHIQTTSQEGIIFFNNLLPTNLQWLFRLTSRLDTTSPLLSEGRTTDNFGVVYPAKIFQDAIKDGKVGKVEVVEVLPRLAEGGAFLKFHHDDAFDARSVTAAVKQYLKTHRAGTWWNPWTTVKANLVLGKPWLEDLSRSPFRRLRVEFLPTQPGAEAAELSQEQLYSYFRSFGKLADIQTQASDSKVMPRYAYLDFDHMRKAIMAKNCMHGYLVLPSAGGGKTGTVLRLTYEKKQRSGWIKDWIFGHPRIVIPLIAAFIAGVSIAIFDPVRTLSIKAHITRAFHVEDNKVWRWFRRQGEDLISKVRSLGSADESRTTGMSVVWEDRKAEIEQIKSWLMETADTFVIVQGPRGSGKRELVLDHALKHKFDAHKVLVVDCKPLQEARGDAATISAAAGQVGYRPVFSWMNNISGLMDLAAQGLTGTKAGFSETLENQLVKIWNKTSSALKSIALDGRRKDDQDANLSDDEYLEAHPERRPVVVIEHFLHRNSEVGAALIYDKIAEWAATLTTSNIAHVIFLTNDISYSKSLSKALPDRVFRQLSLGDCSPEVAKRYVINHLDFDAEPPIKAEDTDGNEEKHLTPSQMRKDLQELDTVIEKIGGRLTDLEFLARRIKSGETPGKAVNEIIQQSASEILKIFCLPNSESREWTPLQAWTMIRKLAESSTLRYHETIMDDTFKTQGDLAIAALEQAELISVESLNGRPFSIKPGRPIYQPAFQRLVDDDVLRAKMDLALIGEVIGSENRSIDKYEQELKLLGELPKQPYELRDRMQWLLNKIAASQRHIEDLEKQSVDLKTTLKTQY